MKKVVRLTESDLMRIVKKVINESDRVYGSSEIKNLYSKLGDDEYVELDDSSGELSGRVIRKIEYVKNMLRDAVREKDWSKVNSAISFIDIKIK